MSMVRIKVHDSFRRILKSKAGLSGCSMEQFTKKVGENHFNPIEQQKKQNEKKKIFKFDW